MSVLFFSFILFSCRCPHAVDSLIMDATDGRADQADPGEEEDTRVRDDGSSADASDRQRVLAEVGFTSVIFIGPALPPSRVEPDLEETLSEFYKELQDLDTPDGAAETSVTPVSHSIPLSCIPLSLKPPEVQSGQWIPDEGQERTYRPSVADICRKGGEQKQSSWPHWYNNEPYQRRGPRSNLPPPSERDATDPNQWRHRQSVGRPRPPLPRFHRPRLHRPAPPMAFPYHQNPPPPPPPYVNHDWGGPVRTSLYEQEPGFPAFPLGPLPNFRSNLSLRPHTDSGCYFDQPQQHRDYDEGPSSSAGRGWPPYENEGRYKWAAEPDPRDLRCPPANDNSSFVLILMRGLPGSGKSTLARYVVNGLQCLELRCRESCKFSSQILSFFIDCTVCLFCSFLAGSCCSPVQVASY